MGTINQCLQRLAEWNERSSQSFINEGIEPPSEIAIREIRAYDNGSLLGRNIFEY